MIKLGIIGHPLNIITQLQKAVHQHDICLCGYFSENINNPEYNNPALPEYKTTDKLIADSDAIIIATDNSEYYNTAVLALKSAKHLFMPITLLNSVSEANKLIKLASEANVILKVFRPETFFTDQFRDLGINGGVWLIEMHHFTCTPEENPSKQMFFNLVYNLDLILGLTHSNIAGLKATGLNMLSDKTDIINTRIDFDNGCSATLTCSNASLKEEHIATIIQKDKIIHIDFVREDAMIWNINKPANTSQAIIPGLHHFKKPEGLSEGLNSFIKLLKEKNRLLNNPEDNFKSFVLAHRIIDKVNKTTLQSI
jgi:predicted dehydrogenase